MPTHHALAQEADAMKRYAITLTRDLQAVADACMPFYERLHARRLRPGTAAQT